MPTVTMEVATPRPVSDRSPTGTHKISASGSHKLSATGIHKLDASGIHKLDATGSHKLNATGTHKLNATGTHKLSSTGTHKALKSAAKNYSPIENTACYGWAAIARQVSTGSVARAAAGARAGSLTP